jgi:hypothetical protein
MLARLVPPNHGLARQRQHSLLPEVSVVEMQRPQMIQPDSNAAPVNPWGTDPILASSGIQIEAPASDRRELPDVTGFLVMLLVTVGLFVVPVGATIMQGPAIVASLFAD